MYVYRCFEKIGRCLGAYLPSVSDEPGSRRASAEVRVLRALHNINREEDAKLCPFPERESARTHAGSHVTAVFIIRERSWGTKRVYHSVYAESGEKSQTYRKKWSRSSGWSSTQAAAGFITAENRADILDAICGITVMRAMTSENAAMKTWPVLLLSPNT